MKYVFTAMIAFVAVALAAAPATADWYEGDPYKMHFPQLPDKTDTGVDVLGTYPYPSATALFGKILADDWKCTQTGLVSDIHVWGSWLYDELPEGTDDDGTTVKSPRAVGFKLSIHDNVPASPDIGDYSRPGVELWGQFFPAFDPRVKVREEDAQGQEMFWDPNPDGDGEQLGFDNIIYQYNFFMKPEDTQPIFEQKEGEIYWLNVMAVLPIDQPATPQPLWGWKTADRFKYPDDPPRPELHFEDDAVFGDIDDPFGPADPGVVSWQPLKYPSFHEKFAGQSMDLAFVITPEPGTVAMLIGAGLIGLLAYARRRRKN